VRKNRRSVIPRPRSHASTGAGELAPPVVTTNGEVLRTSSRGRKRVHNADELMAEIRSAPCGLRLRGDEDAARDRRYDAWGGADEKGRANGGPSRLV
jgi:hypothetical protein